MIETAVMLGGVLGLIGGLYLLSSSPLPGAITMLASMTLVLSSVSRVSAAQEVRQRYEVTQVSAHRMRPNLGHRSCFPR